MATTVVKFADLKGDLLEAAQSAALSSLRSSQGRFVSAALSNYVNAIIVAGLDGSDQLKDLPFFPHPLITELILSMVRRSQHD